jgi:hypothetical protein
LDTQDPAERLSTAVEQARSHLRALLESPSPLTPKQREEVRTLADPERSRLGADVDLHRKWCDRAIALLQAIDQTPQSALSDSAWSALLAETRRAIEEAQTAVRRIGFILNVDVAFESMRDVEPWKRIKGPGEVGGIGDPRDPRRSIEGPEDPGRSIGGP